MALYARVMRVKKKILHTVLCSVVVLQLGACDLGEFTTTSTVTLDGREVVLFLIRTAILTPIQNFVDAGVNAVFDRFEDDNDS